MYSTQVQEYSQHWCLYSLTNIFYLGRFNFKLKHISCVVALHNHISRAMLIRTKFKLVIFASFRQVNFKEDCFFKQIIQKKILSKYIMDQIRMSEIQLRRRVVLE